MKKMASMDSPTTPNPPTSVAMAKEPAIMKESGQGHTPVQSQPALLEETDGSGKSVKAAGKEGSSGAAPGRPRPPRPAPSRPSRPPAGMYMDTVIFVQE